MPKNQKKSWGIRKATKSIVRAGANSIKKRYVSGKSLNFGNVIGDAGKALTMAKLLAPYLPFNSEKKRTTTVYTNQVLGQVNANFANYFAQDITPTITEGVQYNARTGCSVKLSSACFKFQLTSMASTTQAVKIKYFIVQIDGGNTDSATTVATKMFEPNGFLTSLSGINIYDYNSRRDPDYYQDFKVIRSGVFKMKEQSIAGVSELKDITLLHRFNRGKGKHLRYDNDTATITHGKLFLIMLADCGNINSGSNCTLTGIPVKPVNTGINMNFDATYYYYDN